MVWSCLPFIRSGQNHHARHSERGKKTRQTEEEVVKRGRRQGRQKKRWVDNIKKWTDLEFAKSQRAVKNREEWRKLVAKSSVEPQRPLRLRDR